MHATIRRYEGVDTTRMSEVVGQVNKTLVPQLRELPGFSGYYLIEAGNGVLSSFGLFETSEQADESKTVVTKWISDENFSTVIPNAPKITSGKVVAHSDGVPPSFSPTVLCAVCPGRERGTDRDERPECAHTPGRDAFAVSSATEEANRRGIA